MSFVSYFFASRQAIVLGGSACVAVTAVAVSLSDGNNEPQVASMAPSGFSAPQVPARTETKATVVAVQKPIMTPALAAPKATPETGPVAQLKAPGSLSAKTSEAAKTQVEIQVGSGEQEPTPPRQADNVLVASANLDAAPGVATAPLGKPDVGAAADRSPRNEPKFDLVRVDKAGSAVVAGKATPGKVVIVSIDGVEIAQAKTNARGGFVALFDVPVSNQPQVITLSAKDSDGKIRLSSEQVVVVGRKATPPLKGIETATKAPVDGAPVVEKDTPPAIILTSDEGVKVVQPAAPALDAPEVMANVSLDLISYDTSGEVVLTGRSKPDQHVRIYLDGKPVKTDAVDKDGAWQLSLPDVDAGRYTLRIDEIDSEGQVTSRLETPFQKEFADDVKRVASNGSPTTSDGAAALPNVQKITIQRGATLWALAEQNYGNGDLYMQIFNANRDTIRDPNLIYPGQIFKIPD